MKGSPTSTAAVAARWDARTRRHVWWMQTVRASSVKVRSVCLHHASMASKTAMKETWTVAAPAKRVRTDIRVAKQVTVLAESACFSSARHQAAPIRSKTETRQTQTAEVRVQVAATTIRPVAFLAIVRAESATVEAALFQAVRTTFATEQRQTSTAEAHVRFAAPTSKAATSDRTA